MPGTDDDLPPGSWVLDDDVFPFFGWHGDIDFPAEIQSWDGAAWV